jgi:hypothetical protein
MGYDGVFRIVVPEQAKVVGFADDIAVVVTAKYIEEVEVICNNTVKLIEWWFPSVGLQLAQ